MICHFFSAYSLIYWEKITKYLFELYYLSGQRPKWLVLSSFLKTRDEFFTKKSSLFGKLSTGIATQTFERNEQFSLITCWTSYKSVQIKSLIERFSPWTGRLFSWFLTKKHFIEWNHANPQGQRRCSSETMEWSKREKRQSENNKVYSVSPISVISSAKNEKSCFNFRGTLCSTTTNDIIHHVCAGIDGCIEHYIFMFNVSYSWWYRDFLRAYTMCLFAYVYMCVGCLFNNFNIDEQSRKLPLYRLARSLSSV